MIEQVAEYCINWNLKYILNIKKIVMFKDGGKLKRNDSWTMNDQTIQVTTDIPM